MSNQESLATWYSKNQTVYKRLSKKIESIFCEYFDENKISYHLVTSRTKELDSLLKKAEDGNYSDPINQIQDFSGIRIITYVPDEVEQICRIISDLFDIDEENSSDKADKLGIDKVGYQSVHFIAELKEDRLALPEYKQFSNKCFEIQVRTLLQHTWAEIEHDRNYKFSGTLEPRIQRRFKLLAGVLELADSEFNSISKTIDEIAADTEKQTESGDLNLKLSSTSLTHYLRTKFNSCFEHISDLVPDATGIAIHELSNFGITKLSELDEIIPNDFGEYLTKSQLRHTEVGIIRTLMIFHNDKKYFSEVYDGEWIGYPKDTEEEMYFEKHGKSLSKIIDENPIFRL